MFRFYCLFVVAFFLGTVPTLKAGVIVFNTDPFAGSTALQTPGRQVVGNELSLQSFNVSEDVFLFDRDVFGVGLQVQFFNGFARDLPSGGLNVIVLQDSDNDNNPQTGFGAAAAADLIAAKIDASGPGFFVYFNSTLNLNRLVYSTDLSSSATDLKILARILTPTGQGAIDALPTFVQSNFQFSSVPVPASAFLLLSGLLASSPVLIRRHFGKKS